MITHQEKALELYNYYDQLIRDYTRGVSVKELAKLCALKNVDEMINIVLETGYGPVANDVHKQLLEVQTEIHKI